MRGRLCREMAYPAGRKACRLSTIASHTCNPPSLPRNHHHHHPTPPPSCRRASHGGDTGHKHHRRSREQLGAGGGHRLARLPAAAAGTHSPHTPLSPGLAVLPLNAKWQPSLPASKLAPATSGWVLYRLASSRPVPSHPPNQCVSALNRGAVLPSRRGCAPPSPHPMPP